MKRDIVILTLLLMLLTACVQTKTVGITETPKSYGVQNQTQVEPTNIVNITLSPEFKVTKFYGKKYPYPSINGTIMNVGKGAGSAHIDIQVFYAGVIASEKIFTIDDVKPGDSVNFGTEIDKTILWNGFQVTVNPPAKSGSIKAY